ncbi:MAG: hypothetical protein IJQ23_03345, partial [Clostridia bacterium]|nr:hypothetical protein [Clostridia bacterium]
VNPTCTEKGSYDSVVYCSECGAELSREHTETNALGHTAADPVEENTVNPTCTEKGSYDSVVYCSECGAELSRESKEIAASGHQLGEEIAEVPATETSTGTKAHKDCSVCGKHFDADGNEIEDLTIAKLEPAQKGCNSSIGGAEIILIVFVVICAMTITIVKRKKS